ncbi:UNVERIFIED_CONTAM: hypothetical protein NCL1_51933 [Trichonephila clavipes]
MGYRLVILCLKLILVSRVEPGGGGSHSSAQRTSNPEFRVESNFRVIPEQVEEDKATDYAHLKQALTEQFPVVRNRSELETRFYASYQNYNQRPPDFVYELLTIHKQLKLDMREEKLLDHIISRLELLDYVEVRHPQTTSNLLQIIYKYEESFLERERFRCSSQEFRDAGHSASSPFPNRNGQENWQDARVNNRCTDKSRPQREFNRFEGQGVGDNWRFDSRRQSGQSDHRFNNQSGRKGGSRNGAFRGQNGQNSTLINVTDGAEYVGGNIEKLFDEARQNMRKQHKTWGKYYNRKRREDNIKVNDLVLVQTHFVSAAGRRVVGKCMPKVEGPYTVLKVRNNNLTIWKKGRRVTVNIDQVRVYHQRHSDTNSFDSTNETHYMKERDLVMVDWVEPGKIQTRNNFNPTQGPETISGPFHQQQMRQFIPTKEESRRGARVHSDKARETRTTGSKGHSVAEGRPDRSGKTTVRPCPYYLRSRFKEPEGIPEEQRNTGIDSLTQNSLSMETLDGDPAGSAGISFIVCYVCRKMVTDPDHCLESNVSSINEARIKVSPAGDLVCKNIEVIEDKKHYNTQQTNKKGHIKGSSVFTLKLSLGELVIDSGPGYVISIMAASGSSFIPIPLVHADNLREGHLTTVPNEI